MTKDLDAGDTIGQREFTVEEENNAKDLFDKALKETKFLLKEELMKYLKGELKPHPQDHSKKTYAHKIDKPEAKILWEEPSLNIHNKIRALFLGPQAFFFFNRKRIKIYRSKNLKEGFSDFLPGEVCEVKKNKLFVACSEGTLSLLEVQKEGKKRQKIEDFLKGNSIRLKDRFDQG